MKNVQIIDGADNATFSIFRATEEEFAYIFPNPGQDIEFIEDFVSRHHENAVSEILSNLWLRPVHKSKTLGIDGTLFYGHASKRDHLPASKREIDRDPSQINTQQRELYARLKSDGALETASSLPATAAELLNEVAGGAQLLEWFDGYVPSFHDAEILTLTLDRENALANLRIHTFRMTSTVDTKGYFVLEKHVVVSFQLSGVFHLELNDFNEQNVIHELVLTRTADRSIRLELGQCYGLFGFIEARSLTIALEPGKPTSGIYPDSA